MPPLKAPQISTNKCLNSLNASLQITIIVAVALTPIIFTQRTTELFEFPKMVIIYAAALLAASLIIIKSIVQKKFLWIHSPLTWPLTLFLLWLILTTFTSLSPYTSIAGYYSRFNGGLTSYIGYIILGYALLDQLALGSQSSSVISQDNEHEHSSIRTFLDSGGAESTRSSSSLIQVQGDNASNLSITPKLISPFLNQLLWGWLISATLVSIWGILEHFGHDPSCVILRGTFTANCWVQDVQARVFATFGQPNWLATYLLGTIPIGFFQLFTTSRYRYKIAAVVSIACCYAAFWYTYSRSGWFGLIAALLIIICCLPWPLIWSHRRWLGALLIACVIISASSFNAAALRAETSLADHGADSSTGGIRLLVWQGAWQDLLHHPILGTGLGTFAYSFLPFRPAAINTTTEWNFLYNDAHNQVLNTAATTGLPGLILWLSLFVTAIVCLWRQKVFTNLAILQKVISHQLSVVSNQRILSAAAIQKNELEQGSIRTFLDSGGADLNTTNQLLAAALIASLVGIFVAQLFGFAVVITNLLLFVSLAIIIAPSATTRPLSLTSPRALVSLSLVTLLLVFATTLFFRYVSAELLVKQASADSNPVYTLQRAIQRNPWEPNYRLQLAAAYINSTTINNQDNNYHQADLQLQAAYHLNPHDLIVAKSTTYYYQVMTTVAPSYQSQTLTSAQTASRLAPTDAAATQTLGDLQLQYGQKDESIATFNQLIALRPVAESYFHQAHWYQEFGTPQQYLAKLQHVLQLDPTYKDAQTALQQFNNDKKGNPPATSP